MKSTCSFVLSAFSVSLLLIAGSSAKASQSDHSALKRIDSELKSAWLELDKLKHSDEVDSVRNRIRNSLVASYTAQGKELKAQWIESAPFETLSISIKNQKLNPQSDFNYPAFLNDVVKKEKNEYQFSSRTACNNMKCYLIKKGTNPDLYELCEKLLPEIKADGEGHIVPESFPLDKVLKSEFSRKYEWPTSSLGASK